MTPPFVSTAPDHELLYAGQTTTTDLICGRCGGVITGALKVDGEGWVGGVHGWEWAAGRFREMTTDEILAAREASSAP